MDTDDGADARAAVRGYYRALDAGEYDDLAALLTPECVHDRPDRTFEGRERFVRFMRAERPMTDTTHEIAAVYARVDADPVSAGMASGELAARGRLLAADGTEITGFVDVFGVADGRIDRITTYTD